MSDKQQVPDLVAEALKSLEGARNDLVAAMREVTWAYQDLMRQAAFPVGPNDPEKMDREAMSAEFASRAVLPIHLPGVLTKAEEAVVKLKKLVDLVPRLPEPKKENNGNAQAPV